METRYAFFFCSAAPDCGTNPGWRKNNNVCYYYNDTDIVDFYTALMRCYDEKASLVSILDQNEQAYVNSMVRPRRPRPLSAPVKPVCFMVFCPSRWGRDTFLQLGLDSSCLAS